MQPQTKERQGLAVIARTEQAREDFSLQASEEAWLCWHVGPVALNIVKQIHVVLSHQVRETLLWQL